MSARRHASFRVKRVAREGMWQTRLVIIYALGVVLGQHRDNMFKIIYYASKTLDSAQQNYTTTEKSY